ncbi:acyl-CoA thioesterase [Nesterenkonia aerolata]|uniref:Acyl-CoA thioesterase n=1 Tax=Nesterenkonia aerolata TaxID=3074079 RepID=A0ABU2DPS6_9MICC|nr:acyl-CoA thioesterase [Nesterenkonia sp. LY-0111]MDR8018458.1 acyl-CoA thioesterase [Nesterenkonia sp. LY-0111]
MTNERIFSCDLQVRWSDQDLNGHVNNARLITLIEEVRLRAMVAWGLAPPGSSGPRVVRALEVMFDREVHFGAPVLSRAWITAIGRTSFTVRHELRQADELCLRADAVIVNLDPQTGRPAGLEEPLRTVLDDHLISADESHPDSPGTRRTGSPDTPESRHTGKQ